MGMTGGSVRSSTATTVKAVYSPQGVPTDPPLKNVTHTQFVNDQETTLEVGTGSGSFDRATASDRAIPAGASVTYDLYTGADLLGPVGETAAFRIVRKVKISIVSGGASGVRVGGAASNEWVGWFVAAGDKQDIYVGGPPFQQGDPVSGKAVTTTARNLKIENLSSTVEAVVRILVVGNTAAGGESLGWLWLWTYP